MPINTVLQSQTTVTAVHTVHAVLFSEFCSVRHIFSLMLFDAVDVTGEIV